MFGSYANKKSINKYSSLLENKKTTSKVIYYCIPNLKKNNFKKIFKKENNEKFIGILGRIETYKGHEDLIKAFSKLPNKIKNKNKIMIIGSGEKMYVDKLKDMIKSFNLNKNVIFTGYLDENIENIMKSLDLVVMATRDYEGFGYTVAEAISAGTPVLASKVGAIQEVMSLNEGGLFKPKNIDELLKNLIDFNKNNNKWKKRAKDAKIKINKRFNSKKIAKEFRNYLIKQFNEKPLEKK